MSSTSIFDQIYYLVTLTDSILSIVLAGSAIYILITKRKTVKNFFTILTNYSLQNTIYELHDKLNKLIMYSVETKSEAQKKEVYGILQEIRGQIEGNKFLKDQFVDDFEEFKDYFDNTKKLTDADKRRIATRLREKLKTLNLEIFNDSVGREK